MKYTFAAAAGMVLVLLVSTGAHAQASIDQSRRNAIVQAIEQVKASVVTVNVVQIRKNK